MKKTIYMYLVLLTVGLFSSNLQAQTTVDEPSNLTWGFGSGAEGQTAVYSGETSVYYSIDDVEVGSNWSYAGAKNWRNSSGTVVDTLTGFETIIKSSSPTADDYVLFNIRPNADLTFTPTTITFDCGKFGTSGGKVDVAWVAADGTETVLQTDIIPARDNDTEDVPTNTSITVNGVTSSAGLCKLKFYIYSLDPGKQVGLGDIVVEGTLTGTDNTQTKVDDTPTLKLDLNSELTQVATYSGSTADYFNADNLTYGSNWSNIGQKTWRNSGGTVVDTLTGFETTIKNSSPTADDYVMFNIRPKTALTFVPSSITFDCGRYGTSGGKVDVAWVSADGTETVVQTDIIPARDNDTEAAPTNTVIDVSSLSLSDSIGNCGVKFYIYSLDPGKQVGIGDVVVEGTLTGFMSNIESYSLTIAASPDTAGVASANLPGDVFDDGTELSLTATKNFGFEFSHWVDGSGDSLTSNNPFVFTISQDTVINAVFDELNTYSLDVMVINGNDYMVSASVEPTIVDGKNMYEEGVVVTLTAMENDILSFNSWSTDETTTSIDVTMDEDKSINADYIAIDYLVGWDFYESGNSELAAAFYSSNNSGATLSKVLISDNATTSSWLDFSYEARGENGWGTPKKNCAILWDGTVATNYYRIVFDATGYTDIKVSAALLSSYSGYNIQNVDYSFDGVNYTSLGSDTLTAQNAWFEKSFALPSECDNASMVYVRWIADVSSTLTSNGNDGTSIADIYVTGTPYQIAEEGVYYNIIQKSTDLVVGADIDESLTQPAVMTQTNSGDQAFQFIPVEGKENTYLIQNMEGMYLNKAGHNNWTTLLSADVNGLLSEWVVSGTDTSLTLQNVDNLGSLGAAKSYISTDDVISGSNLYCDKPVQVEGSNGEFMLQEATVYTPRKVAYVTSGAEADFISKMLDSDAYLEVDVVDGSGDYSSYDLVIGQETFSSGDGVWSEGGSLYLKNAVPMIMNKTWAWKSGKPAVTSTASVDRVADVSVIVDSANQSNPLYSGITFTDDNAVRLYAAALEGGCGVDVLNGLAMSNTNTLLASASSLVDADSAIVINDIPAGTQIGTVAEDVTGARIIALAMCYPSIADSSNITSENLTIWRNAAYILTGMTPPTELFVNEYYVTPKKVAYVTSGTADPISNMLDSDNKLEVDVVDGSGDYSSYDLIIGQETFGSGDGVWSEGGSLYLKNTVPMIMNKTWAWKSGKPAVTSTASVDRVADVSVIVDPASQSNPLFSGITFTDNAVRLYGVAVDGCGVDVLNGLAMSNTNTLLASASSLVDADSAIVINDIPAGTQIGTVAEDLTGARIIALAMCYPSISDSSNITSENITIWRNAAYILTGMTPPAEMFVNSHYEEPTFVNNSVAASNATVLSGPGYIRVVVEEPTDVTIYSIDGKIVAQKAVESSEFIPCSQGINIVKIQSLDGAGIEIFKVLVK